MSVINSYKVCFLGRTGNGKTTLINALFGTNFNTDPLVACTKELYSVTLMNNCPEGFEGITVYDTPGIGEFSSDAIYQRFYEEAVSEANCIVLVTTLDRTDAPAQRLISRILPFVNAKAAPVKFVVAVNHIDSKVVAGEKTYTPWDDIENKPTETCLNNIEERIDIINQRFNKYLPISAIVPVSGLRKYGINELKTIIES